MPTDAELLRRYVEARDETAFAEFVRRHLPLVYAAALRRTNGRNHVAEEIAQKVFTDLARKAASLQHHPALTGWLHRSTRYAAIDAARSELRREKLTQSLKVLTDDLSLPGLPTEWENLRPVIDESMDELKEADREVILLRYFEGLTFAAVSERTKLSENAARMRAERALGKLRVQLGKRGVTSSAAVLGLSLANQGMGIVPTGLAAGIIKAAMATAPAGVVASLLGTLALNKTMTAAIAAGLMAGAFSVGWGVRKAHADEAELAALRAENSRLSLALAGRQNETTAVAVAIPVGATASTAFTASTTTPDENRSSGRQISEAGQHRDHGQATALNALLSYAWACDTSNAAAVSRLITFTDAGREELARIYARAPASVRARYLTPEELFIHSLLVSSVLKPPTGVEQIKKFVATEVDPDRVHLRKAGTKGFSLVHTAEGWKIEMPIRPGSGIGLRTLESEIVVKLGIN